MWDFLERAFGEGFMPHGHCYLWTPSLVWLEVSSNLLIGFAYVAIAATLFAIVRQIRNIPFPWIYVAFSVFILSCGLTHFFDVVTVWHPVYWADGSVRALTAIASIATAVVLVPLVPKAVALAEAARVSQERGEKLQTAFGELAAAHDKTQQMQRLLQEREQEAQRRADISEERFRLLVETMPQLAWVSAPDGKNLFRNGRWSQYTGLSLEELDARGWESVHDPAMIEHVVERWKHSLRTGTPFEIESRLRGADGTYRWFITRAMPLKSTTGTLERWIGTYTDIHDQRALREEAIRTAQMKDEFLATISHELRTPLNAMLGWSRMLRTNALPAGSREKAIESIERNAVAQAQLIDDLLDISRIVSGKMRLERALVDPAKIVEAALDSVSPMALGKQVRLHRRIAPGIAPIMGDAARVQQIVWNLLVNAVKFTPKGGEVTVAVEPSGGQIEISVADTGKGISAEFLPYVFERFTQADGSKSRRHGGLGLGLSISKHFVELHGGTIEVHSAGEGQGALFKVSLPMAILPSPKGTAPRVVETSEQLHFEPPKELFGLRILVVEDEADSREMVTTLLRQCGLIVTSAENTDEGLARLKEEAFDIILSDIGLPDEDGYAFLEKARKLSGVDKIPAAALTAYAHAEDRRKALLAGYQMHVPKPVEPVELAAVLANLARIGSAMRT